MQRARIESTHSLRRNRLKFLNSLQPLGLLILRAAIGVIFFAHGYPKLMHSDGPLQATFVQHGLPAQFVVVAGVLETFGGLLLVLGLFTRGAALLLAIELSIEILKLHSGRGIMALHEYEFPLALAAACVALATVGAGAASVDHFLFGEGGPSRPRAAKPSKK